MRRRAAPITGLGVVIASALLTATLSGGGAAQDPQCPRWRAAFAEMPTRPLTISTSRGPVALRVRAAETSEQQAAGFQCATPREIKEHLVLFDFGREIVTRFHMQNVPAPLDIAFAKADGRIFTILRMDPSPSVLYGPLGEFRYALEAPVGFFHARGIRAGEARLVPQP